MMRRSETMRAASRLLLSHPIVCLLAALAAVVVLGVLGPLKVVHAADVTVEGETFDQPASGTNVITGAGYNGGAALKFTANVTANSPVNCSAPCDVVLMASGGQSGGQATFSVNGSLPQALTSTTTTAYTFHLPDGATTISVKAGGTGTGHNAILDVAQIGGGSDPGADRDGDTIPDASDNCPDVYNPQQADRDGDGVGNKCDTGSTPPTDTDSDGVPDSSDNCPSVYNPRQGDTDHDGVGNKCDDGSTPPTDTDNDGVIDVDDQCPNDPGPASNNGCPITGGSVHIVGAGDIADNSDDDAATAQLVQTRLDANSSTMAFTAGDNAYPNGASSDFSQKYQPTWGAFKNRTYPSPGNHDWNTSGASGYMNYFGSGTPPAVTVNPTYYAYTLGSWRIYSLDSKISMKEGSHQYTFVQQDLTKNGALCELAYWHHPVFSSGQHGNIATARPIFQLFDEQGGDLVINGHDHNYERFKEINYLGDPTESGVREIIVGTGGTGLRGPGFVQDGISEVRIFNTHGIVDISLDPTGYSGQFVPVPGETSTDRFSGTCGT
jgi:hypothetical protein